MPSLLSIVACTGSFYNMYLLIRFLEATILAHNLFCNLMSLFDEHTFSLCNISITSFLPVRWWIVRPIMSCFPFLPGSKFSQSHAIAQFLVPKSEDKVSAYPTLIQLWMTLDRIINCVAYFRKWTSVKHSHLLFRIA